MDKIVRKMTQAETTHDVIGAGDLVLYGCPIFIV